MSFTIRTVGADCAKGLINMALTGLGVTHSADLFHGQYELTGAYSRRLSLRVQAAAKAHCEAVAATEAVRDAQRAYETGPRGPGRPPEWPYHVAVAEHRPRLAASTLHDARTEQESMREVVRGLIETQRVLHNFLIRRADGTTAAERLFRATHGDLVEYLTARTPLPAMPRRRTPRVESAVQRLNL